MISNQRIFHDDNGTLKDLSKGLNDLFANTGAIPIVAAEDYIYIGSDLPFNHRYFVIQTANSQSSVVSVDIYDGNNWNAAVDIIDYTDSGGASMAQNGWIRWSLGRNNGWGKVATTADVAALSSVEVYNMYWCRLKWSADFDVGTTLQYVGHKFADDNALRGRYPDLLNSSLIDAWESGKTDWEEQHILAAEDIVRELRKDRIIWSRQQILEWQQFELAAVHKVAEIIYNGFNDEYVDSADMARKMSKEALQGPFVTDRDEDGHVDEREQRPFVGIVRR